MRDLRYIVVTATDKPAALPPTDDAFKSMFSRQNINVRFGVKATLLIQTLVHR